MLKTWSEIGIGKHMTEEAVLCTASFSEYEALQAEFALLNQVTEKHGTRYSLGERQSDGRCILRITVLEEIMKRHAGPKRKMGALLRIAEVYRYQCSHSVSESAAFAGVHIRSYQRRVKKYREEGKWHEESQGFF